MCKHSVISLTLRPVPVSAVFQESFYGAENRQVLPNPELRRSGWPGLTECRIFAPSGKIRLTVRVRTRVFFTGRFSGWLNESGRSVQESLSVSINSQIHSKPTPMSLSEYRCFCERQGASRRFLHANYPRLAPCRSWFWCIGTDAYELAAGGRFLRRALDYDRSPSTRFPCTSVNR
jgi:hypothetical protein